MVSLLSLHLKFSTGKSTFNLVVGARVVHVTISQVAAQPFPGDEFDCVQLRVASGGQAAHGRNVLLLIIRQHFIQTGVPNKPNILS